MRLFLMRHATTEDRRNKADFERLLTKEGQDEAEQAADFLKDYQIDKLIVSYVKRTMQTSNIVKDKVEIPRSEIVEELYDGSEKDFFDLLSTQDEEDRNILIIGHNPLIFNVATDLVSNSDKNYDKLITSPMPPARIVVINFTNADNWYMVKPNSGELMEIFTPKAEF